VRGAAFGLMGDGLVGAFGTSGRAVGSRS
jgi:hypothetical protein